MIIKAKNIIKKYNSSMILNQINIQVDPGEIISIYGTSGSGKTTLLNILGLLDSPTEGYVEYHNNLDCNAFSSADRVNTIGYIFQFHHLLSEFKIIDNLIIPQLLAGKKYSESVVEAKSLLNLIGLENLSDRYPEEISGGERQRIAVLRCVVNKPDIVFADEPTGNLDNENSLIIIKLLNDLRKDFNISFVIATHDKQVTKISDKSFYIIDRKLNTNTKQE